MRLSPENRRHAILLAIVIGGLNALGFFLLFALVAPQNLALQSGGAFGIGLGLTAWTLGMRHAFDADHIAAIDNVTRKLKGEGKDTLSVGFFFSLGHSTIVVALGALVAVGVKGIAGTLENENSLLNQITGTWGPTVAGLFLLLVGVLNLIVLVNVAKVFRTMRGGEVSGDELDRRLEQRGILNRFYRRATGSITRPWQMYPVGVMFGFGFDTATEIALLLLAGGAAASGLPFYAVMCLPILFAAGMTLFDTLNSVLMNAAYGWAFDQPVRKVFYNLTVTTISVVAALTIGVLSLSGVLIERLGLTGGVWSLLGSVDLEHAGYAMVALFAAIFALSLLIWRYGRIEERWSAAG
jgi:high-affinity nickel-transport protein